MQDALTLAILIVVVLVLLYLYAPTKAIAMRYGPWALLGAGVLAGYSLLAGGSKRNGAMGGMYGGAEEPAAQSEPVPESNKISDLIVSTEE